MSTDENPISVEFRQRLLAAVERPLRVRREILSLAGHACGHPGSAARGCRTCRKNWPCGATLAAARSALDAFADTADPTDQPGCYECLGDNHGACTAPTDVSDGHGICCDDQYRISVPLGNPRSQP